MEKDEKNIEESVELPKEEAVGEDTLSEPSVDASVASLGDASSDSVSEPAVEAVSEDASEETSSSAVAAEPALSSEPSLDAVSVDEPVDIPAETPAETPAEVPATETSSAPAAPSTDPAPGYGAPGMLFEDFIPYEFLHEGASSSSSESSAEAAARAAALAREEEEKKKNKKKEKEKKPSKEEADLLAAIEAEMASRAESASKPAAPKPAEPKPSVAESAPTESSAPADSAASRATDTSVVAPIASTAMEPEEAIMAEETTTVTPPDREYTPQEKKLRKKYKLDKDTLLSKNDAIPGFILAKGENVVRSYYCLDSAKGMGTICLTNKRILINADECSEVEVSNVSGVKFSQNTYFSFFKFLFALIFFGLGAFMIALPFIREKVNIPYVTGDAWKAWFQYLFIACGAVSVLISLPLWAKMVKKYFYFNIFIKESTPFFECKSWSVVKSEKKGGQFKFLVSAAGKEVEKAARELGALILEVKDGRYDF